MAEIGRHSASLSNAVPCILSGRFRIHLLQKGKGTIVAGIPCVSGVEVVPMPPRSPIIMDFHVLISIPLPRDLSNGLVASSGTAAGSAASDHVRIQSFKAFASFLSCTW